MNLDDYTKKQQIIIIGALLVPLLASVSYTAYLKHSWAIDLPTGEVFSPIDNRPLFVGLIMFILGYLFFLGLLFSDNILDRFNRRRAINRR